MESLARADPSEQSAGERDPHGWGSAGRRGCKNNLRLAKTLVRFERQRLQGQINSRWDAQLSRKLDRLLGAEEARIVMNLF